MAILSNNASVVRRMLGIALLLCVLIGVLASNSSLAFASPKTGGVEKWAYKAQGYVESSPDVVNGVVYVG